MASLGRTYLVPVAVILLAGGFSAAMGSTPDTGRLIPWRPEELSAELLEHSPVKARQAASRLSYTDEDADRLLLMAIGLPPAESAPALIRYADACLKKRGKTDVLWGRAVYAVGVARGEVAAKYLMEQWDDFDRRLATGALKLAMVPEPGVFEPLNPLTDAVHFCFGTPAVRNWAMKRINEELPSPKEIDRSLRHRRLARRYLLRGLLQWDIAEAADSASALRPEQLLERQVGRSITPRDLEPSCKAVLEWVGRVPVLPLDANEKQWLQWRMVDAVRAVEAESTKLGVPLALKLYELYLKPVKDGDNDKEKEKNKAEELKPEVLARVWMIATLAVLDDATLARALRPNDAVRKLLEDAADYHLQLPRGEVRKNGAECLLTLQCYAEPEPSQPWWQATERLAKSDLTPQEQQAIVARVAHFRGLDSPKGE